MIPYPIFLSVVCVLRNKEKLCEEIIKNLQDQISELTIDYELISLIKVNNPKAFIITTVSPVRHLKNGFVDNNLSKAHLITAIHQVLSSESLLKTLFYFPSYEIMMDELRDYRFYKEDMIHPNNTAVSIILEAFNKAWISSETVPFKKLF